MSEELGDRWGAAMSLRLLGHIADAESDIARAVTLHEESLARHQEAGVTWSIAEGLYYLGRTLSKQGDPSRAESLLLESLARCRALHYRLFLPAVLRSLGEAARIRGDLDCATTYLAEGLDQSLALSDAREVAATLEGVAATAAARGRAERAARLLGAAEALRATSNKPLRPQEAADRDGAMAFVREALTEPVLSAAWAEGRVMSVERAVAFALSGEDDLPAHPAAGPAMASPPA